MCALNKRIYDQSPKLQPLQHPQGNIIKIWALGTLPAHTMKGHFNSAQTYPSIYVLLDSADCDFLANLCCLLLLIKHTCPALSSYLGFPLLSRQMTHMSGVMMATGIARIAIINQSGHVTLRFMTALFSDGNSDPSCGHRLRITALKQNNFANSIF